MSDTPATESQPTQPFYGFEGYEVPPQSGFVVHQLLQRSSAQPIMWGWCLVAEGQHGYSSVSFTYNDGVTVADPGPDFQLGPVLFKVFC
jgi:hypothetical protein